MTDARPDPDQLLSRIKQEEARARRGKLRIFFGASAGVGKTYAMLNAARQQLAQGVDVAIGVVETHGRKETEAMVEGFERLPLKELPYRNQLLPEFDLDGALARHPALILVDELAHSNVAGSRHPKRWQDVEELLDAGIDVYSTMNVQHLETLNDIVGGITGIRVWEMVPDKVFDNADEVVLVDLPPDELLHRLKEGKVYMPRQAERAISNFFRKGNLIALRELALRRTADRVDGEMQQYRHDKSLSPVWQTRDSLLACIGPGEGGEKIVRTAARFASQLDVPWHTIYIETAALLTLSKARRQRVLKTLKLAQEMGAETAALADNDAVEGTVKYARNHNLSKIVVGCEEKRFRAPWHRSFADRISQLAPDLDVILVGSESTGTHSKLPDKSRDTPSRLFKTPWQAYAMSLAACALTTLIAAPLQYHFSLANIVMLFLLTVVLVAVRYGRGPSVLASFVCVAAFDFFYVPPRFSFSVSDVQYLMTFAIMLAVGLITGHLTAGLKYQAYIAKLREERMRALFEMARELSGALMLEQIAEICDRFVESGFSAKASILLPDDKSRLQPPIDKMLTTATTDNALAVDLGIAQWAFDHKLAAGHGTDTLPGSSILYLPLEAPMRVRGVLALEPRNPLRLLIPEQRRLLDTFARLIAIAIERVHYVAVAQSTTVQMETERLRNSLLSAISHDLRTPLSALVGLADSMSLTQPPPSGQQLEIANSMREETLRMNALVNNMLDMARLQSGVIKLNRQWQPLEEVVGSALKAVASSLAGHRVLVHLPEDLPLLEFDAALIERVFCNLLENAAKYTPPGSLIEIGAVAGAEDVEVWVEDNGPGVPPGKEEDIFNKFERGQKEGTTPGVGLGLAICRTIMQTHDGTIRAENRIEGGARFEFSLPRGTPPVIDDIEDDPAMETAPE